jgi:hypothetical protein
MTDFIRNIPADTLFEGVSDDIIPIVLKFKDDYAGTWERNTNNTLKFEQVTRILTSEPHICFFQKQKSDEKNNRSRHKIIVPIEKEKAIELSVVLWTDKVDAFTEVFSYFVGKSKEMPFFTEPNKETYRCNSSFRIVNLNEKDGTKAASFQNLYKIIETFNIPTIDINKEKDKEIWKNYVVALKRLVKQKEQVWKIQNISKPYKENSNEKERATFIDFYISEKDLIQQFEAEIEDYFNVKELEDYGVSEDHAFVEFNNYRELSQGEKDKITNFICRVFLRHFQRFSNAFYIWRTCF